MVAAPDEEGSEPLHLAKPTQLQYGVGRAGKVDLNSAIGREDEREDVRTREGEKEGRIKEGEQDPA